MVVFLGIFFALFALYFLLKVPLGISAWIEERLPIGAFLYEHLGRYPAPKNLNFWYAFGALSMFAVVIPVSYTHLTLPTKA